MMVTASESEDARKHTRTRQMHIECDSEFSKWRRVLNHRGTICLVTHASRRPPRSKCSPLCAWILAISFHHQSAIPARNMRTGAFPRRSQRGGQLGRSATIVMWRSECCSAVCFTDPTLGAYRCLVFTVCVLVSASWRTEPSTVLRCLHICNHECFTRVTNRQKQRSCWLFVTHLLKSV